MLSLNHLFLLQVDFRGQSYDLKQTPSPKPCRSTSILEMYLGWCHVMAFNMLCLHKGEVNLNENVTSLFILTKPPVWKQAYICEKYYLIRVLYMWLHAF